MCKIMESNLCLSWVPLTKYTYMFGLCKNLILSPIKWTLSKQHDYCDSQFDTKKNTRWHKNKIIWPCILKYHHCKGKNCPQEFQHIIHAENTGGLAHVSYFALDSVWM